jgi:hypothetical protein
MRNLEGAAVVLLLSAATLAGCKGPMSKIEAIRDALATDDVAPIRDATSGYPTCTEAPRRVSAAGAPGPYDVCLASIASALGSKRGFVASPPDHAGAATAALVITRDGRGDWLAGSDDWLADVKSGKGTGHDALRLAIARRMADAAPVVGRRLDDDASGSAAMRAVVGAVPGACPTYWLLASGAAPASLPIELSADHSACVHHDLARRDGPGASYGSGHARAVEGALALWREAERALRLGLALAEPGPKAVLEKKLAIVEAATRRIETRKVPARPVAELGFIGELHAQAGVPIVDAGAEGGAPDGGAR